MCDTFRLSHLCSLLKVSLLTSSLIKVVLVCKAFVNNGVTGATSRVLVSELVPQPTPDQVSLTPSSGLSLEVNAMVLPTPLPQDTTPTAVTRKSSLLYAS